jgi:hypothetical protein
MGSRSSPSRATISPQPPPPDRPGRHQNLAIAQIMTLLTALRHDRVTAPRLIDGPITFQLYVEKVLLSTLWPGDIVIMDNLGSHKGKAVLVPSAPPAPGCSTAKLLLRSEPDRTILCQAQTLTAKGRTTNHRCRLQRHRPDPRHSHNSRMRKLLRKCRILTNLIASHSNTKLRSFCSAALLVRKISRRR